MLVNIAGENSIDGIRGDLREVGAATNHGADLAGGILAKGLVIDVYRDLFPRLDGVDEMAVARAQVQSGSGRRNVTLQVSADRAPEFARLFELRIRESQTV